MSWIRRRRDTRSVFFGVADSGASGRFREVHLILLNNEPTLSICHSQRFRTSEESDALPYFTKVNPVPLKICLYIGNPFFVICHPCFRIFLLKELNRQGKNERQRLLLLLDHTRSVFLDEAPLETHAPVARLVIIATTLLLRLLAGAVRRDGGHAVSFFDIARLLPKSLEARRW